MWEGLFIWEWCVYTGMELKQEPEMGRRRALLTDRERELIANENVGSENQRYQAISRVRNKIEDELPEDLAILNEHHPALLSELREEVCGPDNTDETIRVAVDNVRSAYEDVDGDRLAEALNDLEELVEDPGEGEV